MCSNFASLSQPSYLVPGYTGHCPTLKFQFGKCYGTNTKEILKDLYDIGVLHKYSYTPLEDQTKLESLLRSPDNRRLGSKARTRPYILGYTGYIPGMRYHFGTTFRKAADECADELCKRILADESKRVLDNALRPLSPIISIRSNGSIDMALHESHEQLKYRDEHISAEFPPIAGYTGHLPHQNSTDVSLSQRFFTSAKLGLSKLKKQRETFLLQQKLQNSPCMHPHTRG
uniref:Protein FAM166B n=1 Tax=Cacopsylla melanoneura TaxID=428564 RepID=A0A8D8Y8T6_9HEMI